MSTFLGDACRLFLVGLFPHELFQTLLLFLRLETRDRQLDDAYICRFDPRR